MIKIKYFILIFILISGFRLKADINRYVVFFTDKNNSSFSADDPEAFLSLKAIERRNKFDIPVTQKDLPVNNQYINQLNDLGAEVFYKSKWLNAVLIQADDSLISHIEGKNFVLKTEFVAPGKKLTNARTGYYNYNHADLRKKDLLNLLQNDMLGIDEMHQNSLRGDGVTIAVFDGGFLNVDEIPFFNHLFDQEKLVATYDFVDNDDFVFHHDDHGTNVLSCLTAFDTSSYNGAAYMADYMLFVTEDVTEEFRVEEFYWLFAAEYADSAGVDIINSSLGYNMFDDPNMNYTYKDLDGKSAVVTKAASMAAKTGMLVVVSAGNEGNNSWKYIVPPADADSIIAVGAVDSNLMKAYFSSTGPTYDNRIKPDLTALGHNTKVVSGSGNIVSNNGTSFAAPLIAGLAAGIWQANPDLSNWELIELLKNAGSNYSKPDTLIGYGTPDFNQAQYILNVLDNAYANQFKVFPNPFKDNNFFIEPKSEFHPSFIPSVKIHTISGELIDELKIKKLPDKNLFQIDIPEGVPDGVYILAILSDKETDRIKIVKQ